MQQPSQGASTSHNEDLDGAQANEYDWWETDSRTDYSGFNHSGDEGDDNQDVLDEDPLDGHARRYVCRTLSGEK